LLAFKPERYAVHTEVFDGPLELLLYLIKRDGIDARDIPIAHVTEQYLGFISRLEEMNLEFAGDFLVMAAMLCEIKSRDLLPRADVPDDKEEDDPRQQLARRIQEYERYRQASLALARREWLGREVYARPASPIAPCDRPVDPGVDAFGLLEAFYQVLESRAVEDPVHEVELEQYSLQERVTWLLHRLDSEPRGDGAGDGRSTGSWLSDIFREIRSRAQRVITFLALLEMARLQMLDVTQDRHLGPVTVQLRIDPAQADLSAIPGEG
jgi:segregation and condensation protein A